MSTPQDIAAMEAAMWADISDQLAVGAARTSAVEVTEQLARCDLVAQRAAYVVALSTSLAQRMMQCARRASAEASEAAREVLGWAKVGDMAVDQAAHVAQETAQAIKTSCNAPPVAADGADGFDSRLSHAKEEMTVAETRVLELHTKEAAAEANVEAKRREVSQLESELAHLREAVAAARREELEADRSLTDRRNNSLEERRNMESESSAVRHQLQAQRDELEQLKSDIIVERERLEAAREDHAKEAMDRVAVTSQAELSTIKAGSASSRAPAPPPPTAMMTAAGGGEAEETFDNYGPQSSPRGGGPRAYSGTSGGGEQTIESGLAALQNVRNQLRELRGQSSPTTGAAAAAAATPSSRRESSPPRSSYAAGNNSNTSVSSPASDGTLRRAATYASYSSPSGQGHPSLIGSARLQTSASMILESNSAAGPSPWKQRLMKLQGDLRTLRSELGTPTAAGSPAR